MAKILVNRIHDLAQDSALAVAWAMITQLPMTKEWCVEYERQYEDGWLVNWSVAVASPIAARKHLELLTKDNSAGGDWHRNERVVAGMSRGGIVTSPVKEREASIEHLDLPEEQVSCDNCSRSADWRLNFVCGAAMLLCNKCWTRHLQRLKTGTLFRHKACSWLGFDWKDHIKARLLK